MSTRTTVTDLGMRAMNAVHRVILAVSRGHLGWTIGRMTVVELHTVGRSTGRPRSTLLTAPISDSTRLVLVASKGGSDSHPQWYLNLRAHPDAAVTVSGRTWKVHARTATADERAELWPRIVRAYPGYGRYQRKTAREIPVVICEPRSAEGAGDGVSGP